MNVHYIYYNYSHCGCRIGMVASTSSKLMLFSSLQIKLMLILPSLVSRYKLKSIRSRRGENTKTAVQVYFGEVNQKLLESFGIALLGLLRLLRHNCGWHSPIVNTTVRPDSNVIEVVRLLTQMSEPSSQF